MAKVGSLVAAVAVVAALAITSGAQAKGGGGHGRGGGGHHAGGHGKIHFGGGRHHVRMHRGFSRHAFHRPRLGRAARHADRLMMRGRHGPHGWPARFTTGGAAFAPGLAARPHDRSSIRAALPAGLAASFLARPAARAVAWPGPLFWSHGGDDVFWPTAYDAAFWDYGPADMLGGILRPAYGGRSRYAAPRRGLRDDRAFAREEDAGAILCRDQPSHLTNLAAVEQEIRPTEAQRTTFDQLRTTEAAATEIIRGACPVNIPPSPTARREVMAQWVDAILVAVRMVRPPLEAFYRSLNDEQKARFTILGSAGQRGDTAQTWLGSCRDPLDASASVPVEPIVRRLRLTEAQAAALEDFSLASDQAAQKVRDSCPGEAPLTPTGRIAAIEARLTALLGALDTLRAPLDRFYGSLTDAQKAQFDRVGSRTSRRGG